MKIELTDTEVKRLIALLKVFYAQSTDLFELSFIKGILQKMGVKIDDWTPRLCGSVTLDKFGDRDMMQERKLNIACLEM